MEGAEGGSQEDDLELLEGASIKPDWQVSHRNDSQLKATCLCNNLDFSWSPNIISGISLCDMTLMSTAMLYGGRGQSAVKHGQRSCTVSGDAQSASCTVSGHAKSASCTVSGHAQSMVMASKSGWPIQRSRCIKHHRSVWQNYAYSHVTSNLAQQGLYTVAISDLTYRAGETCKA